ncbi:DNA primase [Candidatus Shapirobacteria bacterium]|nr:DNA primase [Candidatus Shapirobacteria bacterium]
MSQVDEVLAKTDIVELIGGYLPLKKAGRNFKALCPFHTEKTPSFIVSPERQIFKCFGCQTGGNAVKFLMEYEKMDFGEALRFLAKRAGITLKSYQPGPEEAKRERLLQLNHLTAELYHFLLLEHRAGEPGRQYLAGRGIKRETIEEFNLGYAPPHRQLLAEFLVKKKGFSREELELSGLVFKGRNGQLEDRFFERLMFPLTDQRGNVLGFSGRLIFPQEGAGKYINTPETLLYHKSQMLFGLAQAKEAIRREKKVLVVEGEFDMISPYQAGIKNVVAIKGSALTEEQVKLLHRFSEEALLALDEDSAGDAATRRGIQVALNEGLNVLVVSLSGKYKDPDEAVRADLNFFKQRMAAAVPVFDFYLASALKRFDINAAWGKKQAVEDLVPTLSGIEDEVLLSSYVKQIASALKIDEEAILAKIAKARKTSLEDNFRRRDEPVLIEKKESRQEVLARYLFALCFQTHQEEALLTPGLEEWLDNPGYRRFVAALEKFLAKEKKFSSFDFSQKLAPELKEIFDEFYLVPLPEKLDQPEEQEKEIRRVLNELRQLYLKKQLGKLTEELEAREKAGEKEALPNLEEKINQVLKELKRAG